MNDILSEVAGHFNLFRQAIEPETVRVLKIIVMWQHGDAVREVEKKLDEQDVRVSIGR